MRLAVIAVGRPKGGPERDLAERYRERVEALGRSSGFGKARVEGLPHCDWVLIDAGDVVVHLFRPEVRSFYNIEKIWAVDAPHRMASN